MVVSSEVQLCTRDPDEARERLSEIYCAHEQKVVRGRRGFLAYQKTSGFPGLDLYDLGYGESEVVVKPEPFDDFVLISLPVGGVFALRANGGELVGVERRPVVRDAYSRYESRWGLGCRLLNVRLGRERVERFAADLKGVDEPVQVRFGLDEMAPAAVQSWHSMARSLWQHIVPSGIAVANPLIRTQVLRLTVAVLLETFPNSISTLDPVDVGFVSSAALRRAMAYIEHCAGENIGLRDIAAAVGLSPRALQAAFRRHKATTPLRYLREVRLRRANAELRDADPDGVMTVRSVAYRWGFGNLGRFAEEHRKAFGVSPSQVLRLSPGREALLLDRTRVGHPNRGVDSLPGKWSTAAQPCA